ncbi:MAG: hypothetical protein ACRDRT_09135 [Pseudonocardiaceae bacterium]
MTASTDGTPARLLHAAERVVSNEATHLEVFGVHLELPPPDQLAFLAGVAVLAVLELIEWPVAGVLAAGHLLMHSHHSRLLRDFGAALEEA